MAVYADIRLCIHKFAIKVKIINKRWESKLKSHEKRLSMTDYPGIFYFCRSCVFADALNLFSSCLITCKSQSCEMEKHKLKQV